MDKVNVETTVQKEAISFPTDAKIIVNCLKYFRDILLPKKHDFFRADYVLTRSG